MLLPVLQQRSNPVPQPATGPQTIGSVKMLRISVTDRCNFRCVYCMPEDGVPFLPSEQILSYEQITQIARAASEELGITQFKITGGEPTVRRDLPRLIAMLRALPKVTDLSMTTNGLLLPEQASVLRAAGLDRVTVSMDSLDPEKFRKITRTGDLAKVIRGIDSAISAGFSSVKINCVTMRGFNDDELVDFARLTLDRPITVRFIEYMPLGYAQILGDADAAIDASEVGPAGGCGAQDRGAESLLPEAIVRERIEAALGKLIPVKRETEAGVGPAVPYRLSQEDARGRIAFISAMSAPFCESCNRLRLTADGTLRSCLFEGGEVNLQPILQAGRGAPSQDKAVAQAMTDCVRLKPIVHSGHGNDQMSRIGG